MDCNYNIPVDLNLAELQFNYNPDLVWINKIPKKNSLCK